MAETKQDQAMVAEAQKIIRGITQHQKNSAEKMTQMEKQVKDLKRAQRLLTESVQTMPVETSGGDTALRSFIRKDGTVQWEEEKAKIDIPGQGHVNYQRKGLLDSDAPCNEWHKDLIRIAQKRAFVKMVIPEKSPNTPKCDLELHRHLERAPREIAPAIRKAFYDGAAVGAEWIPDQFKPELWEPFQIPRNLRALIPSISVERNTILIPRLSRGGRPYKKGEVTSDDPALYTASTVETSQKTINIKGMAVRYVVDDAAMEDSAIALMPTLSRQIAVDLEDAWEDCALNGDTTAVHQDTIASWNIRSRWGAAGLGTTADHRRTFIGLRAAAVDRATSSQVTAPAALALSDLVGSMGSMGEYGAENRYIVASPEVVIQHMLELDQVLTVDKFGPAATILSGQIGSIMGTPILMSRFMGADLNATGIFDGLGGSQSGLVIFNTNSWYQYEKRGILVETDKDIRSGSVNIVATMRNVLDTPDTDATKNVAYLNNMTVV